VTTSPAGPPVRPGSYRSIAWLADRWLADRWAGVTDGWAGQPTVPSDLDMMPHLRGSPTPGDGHHSRPPDPQGTYLMEPILTAALPHHRAIVALDIECSTSRPDPVKAELRNKLYGLFDAALCSAGIHSSHRDRFIDRGDGLMALIHPVDQAPKVLLLSRAIPAFNLLLTDYNASLPGRDRAQRQLRVRVVVHAGEVHYDANGCFGEALDVAFRLLDATRVKRVLRETADPLILVVSGTIYSSVVRHGYDGIDQHAFHQLVRVQIAGNRYPGWIRVPGQATQYEVTERPLRAVRVAGWSAPRACSRSATVRSLSRMASSAPPAIR
jgi:class 3 adenylate cyclase